MGIEFRESSLLIAPKTTTPARKNQIYNLNVGLAGLANKEASDKEGKTYAFFIGDTVLVNEVSWHHTRKNPSSKHRYKDIFMLKGTMSNASPMLIVPFSINMSICMIYLTFF